MMVNFYGIAFIAFAITAILLHSKAFVGVLMLIVVGVYLLRKKVFGVYAVLFMAFIVAGMGLLFVGLAINDMFHRIYQFDMLLIGLVLTVLPCLTFYFFTRREVADIFGVPKITILEKIDKKELVAAGKFLALFVIAVGLTLLACYLVVMRQ